MYATWLLTCTDKCESQRLWFWYAASGGHLLPAPNAHRRGAGTSCNSRPCRIECNTASLLVRFEELPDLALMASCFSLSFLFFSSKHGSSVSERNCSRSPSRPGLVRGPCQLHSRRIASSPIRITLPGPSPQLLACITNKPVLLQLADSHWKQPSGVHRYC